MEYGLLIVIIIICAIEYIEIARLKSQVKNQQQQIDQICNATTNEQISANYISDELKQDVTELKRAGKDTEAMSLKINDVMTKYLATKNIDLIDFKLEFGKYHGEILLGDELSPDNCRFWDSQTHEKLDKDRFRRDLGNVEDAYKEVLHRLTGETL